MMDNVRTIAQSHLFFWLEKTVIEAAQKPWTVRFYKHRASACGLGKHYIEDWDTSMNIRVKTYTLGDDRNRYVLDACLKEKIKYMIQQCREITDNAIVLSYKMFLVNKKLSFAMPSDYTPMVKRTS